MKTANCPSCGAPVNFRSSASAYAVCEFCRSTLLRDGEDLKNLGRMADLLDDPTLIQIGTEGTFRGLHFGVIGRIQLKHESGLWNEWHILFDDGRSSWLSEASGEFVVSSQVPVSEPIPEFAALAPEMQVNIAGRYFTVTDLEQARCIAGQGELPFKVGAGYPVNTVDLRGGAGGGGFATLDYSETPPLLFVGEPVDFKSLKMNNLREGMPLPTASVAARVFRCPSCGSPMQARGQDIVAAGCASCGAVVDTSDENYKLISKAMGQRDEKYKPRLPLGSKGTLEGKPVEVIGFLVKQTKIEASSTTGASICWPVSTAATVG